MAVDAKVMNLAVRYWYARDTLTPEQVRFCEDVMRGEPTPPVIPSKETDDPKLIAHARALKEGPTSSPQWEAGPRHPLDVSGGVKK